MNCSTQKTSRFHSPFWMVLTLFLPLLIASTETMGQCLTLTETGQLQSPTPSIPNQKLGWAVDMTVKVAIMGAPGFIPNDLFSGGSAHVYSKNPSEGWDHIFEMDPSDNQSSRVGIAHHSGEGHLSHG